jgi:glycosyltransferase involved in cell wall biosynthesis
MRIVHVEKQTKWAGQPKQAFFMARGLHERGHQVLVVCQPNSVIGDRSREAGIDILELPMKGGRIFTSAARLAAHLLRNRYDIIHPHGSRDHILASMATLWLPGIKLVRSKHSLTPVKGALFYKRSVTRFAAISRATVDVLKAAGIPDKKIRVVPDGLDFTGFENLTPDPALLAEFGIEEDHFVLGTMARLGSKSKGIPDLLQAVAHIKDELPQMRLLLIGRSAPHIDKMVADLGLTDRAIFTGFRQDVARILACVDLYVQPSKREALCSSVIEAMAMAKAVVATRVGGIPEAVEEGKTGLLCEPENPDDLAAKILELVGDAGRRADMGRMGRERALQCYGLDRMLDALEELYSEIIEAR